MKPGRMSRWESTDKQLPGSLRASSDLDDGVESLDYWRQRRQQLPWHRIRARREATRMMVRWEQRVGAAILSQQGAPLETRVSAGVLVARTRLGRWTRRAAIAAVATVTAVVVLLAILAAAVGIFLLHAL